MILFSQNTAASFLKPGGKTQFWKDLVPLLRAHLNRSGPPKIISNVLTKSQLINKLIVKSHVLCLVIQSCPTLCDPVDCSLSGSSVHGDSPGKNIGVSSHSLLHGIFPNQVSNPGLRIADGFLLSEPPGKPNCLVIADNIHRSPTALKGRKLYTGHAHHEEEIFFNFLSWYFVFSFLFSSRNSFLIFFPFCFFGHAACRVLVP